MDVEEDMTGGKYTLLSSGIEPWLLQYVGPKDEAVNEVIKQLPGVAWDSHGRRWLVPSWYHHVLRDIAGAKYDPSITVHSADKRIWVKKEAPHINYFAGKFVIQDAEKFLNPESQRTQRLIQELAKKEKPPLFMTSEVDLVSDMWKAFHLLELAYPGMFGRWPERYMGSWRFLSRYADWEETRFGRMWGGLRDHEHREEYLARLRSCATFDEPPEPVEVGAEDIVEAKGLFE
jgi:hypothetical protein